MSGEALLSNCPKNSKSSEFDFEGKREQRYFLIETTAPHKNERKKGEKRISRRTLFKTFVINVFNLPSK